MRSAQPLERLGRAALSLLYPARCAACDEVCGEERAFCPICELSLERVGPACLGCALPLVAGTLCLSCQRHRRAFSRARSVFQFGGALAQGIRRFKWGRAPELGRPLGRLLTAELVLFQVDLVIPVPLHPHRLRKREFNQAALLALGAGVGRRSVPRLEVRTLARVRDTPPQSTLDGEARRSNVENAFQVLDARRIQGKRALLVDDVLTTGATANACSRTLLAAGAAEVAVLTLARAVP